jgi:hypothetical protein
MDLAREVVTLSRIGAGLYVMSGSPVPVELRMSRWRSRGDATVGGRRYELRRAGILDRRVCVLDQDGAEVLGLSRRNANVPGLPGCEWRVRSRWRGYEGRISCSGTVEMVARTGYSGRSNVTAEIAGTVPNRDLVVVAVAFALLLRRREDTDAGVAVVASTAAIG